MDPRAIAAAVSAWLAEGRRAAVASPVGFSGFSSRRPGEMLVVNETGERVGRVLGSVTSDNLAEQLADLLQPGRPPGRLIRVPVSATAAAEAGLACGGMVTVALHDAGALPAGFWSKVVEGRSVALVSVSEPVSAVSVGEPGRPAEPRAVESLSRSLSVSDDDVTGSFSDPNVNEEAIAAGRDLLARARPAGSVVEAHGRRVVIQAIVPTVRLLVVGNGDLATALLQQGELVSWQVSVFDDPASATEAIAACGSGDGVVVLSHDPVVDTPALAAALASDAAYVGALGSRRTQTARGKRLLALGLSEAALGRIHGPAGLDLGARTPEEIALAICAELLAVRSGRAGTSLRGREAPINA
jgi:xanthine dehydrogenase accessory factor